MQTIVNNYQQSVSYPTGTLNTLPHNVNVKVTPKGHPLNFPQNNQQQFLYNPTPSSFPFQQNQNQQNPTVTRVRLSYNSLNDPLIIEQIKLYDKLFP